ARAVWANSALSATARGSERARVVILKSVYFIFKVTVRPRSCFSAICAQTMSMMLSSASRSAVPLDRSSKKVRSLPSDSRRRLPHVVAAGGPPGDAAARAIDALGAAAELLAQAPEVLGWEVRSGLEASAGHLPGTARTAPVEPPDRKVGDACRAVARPDDAE